MRISRGANKLSSVIKIWILGLFLMPLQLTACPVKINGEIANSQDVTNFYLEPFGENVAFVVSQTGSAGDLLYSNTTSGGAQILLDTGSTSSADGGRIEVIGFIRGGEEVVYVDANSTGGTFYTIAIAGGARTRLASTLVPPGAEIRAEIMRDGPFLVYQRLQEVEAVSTEGGTPMSLGSPGVSVTLEGLTGTGEAIISQAEQTSRGGTIQRLYAQGVASSVGTQLLSGILNYEGGAVTADAFASSSEDAWVLFLASDGGPNVELYTAAVAGPGVASGPIKLSTGFLDPSRVGFDDYEFLADRLFGTAFFFTTQGPAVSANQVSFDGSFSLNNKAFIDNLGTDDLRFLGAGPDPKNIVYFAQGFLRALDISNGIGRILDFSSEIPVGSGQAAIAPDGRRALYVDNLGDLMDPQPGLFAVQLAGADQGSTIPVRLSQLSSSNNVYSQPFEFKVEPNGFFAVYSVDQQEANVREIYSIRLDGGIAIELNCQLVNGGDIQADTLEFSRLGDRVLFIADAERNNRFELYSAPVSEIQSKIGNFLRIK